MAVIVFQDGTSATKSEWEDVLVREEIFRNGILSLLYLKDQVKPSTKAAIKYIEDRALRKKIRAKNGQSCW